MKKQVISDGTARGRRKRDVLVLLVLCVVSIVVVLMTSAAGNQREAGAGSVPLVMDETQVIAHRAGAALAPENTLAALEKAIAIGADMAEIDIQMTRDGVLVAMHDGSLERTTGMDCSVWEADCGAVQKLDAGTWYSGEFAGERVPTLENIAEAAQGKIHLMIEVKCACNFGQELVEEAVGLIRAAGMEKECVIACADLCLLQRSKELEPRLDTVYIGKVMPMNLSKLDYVDGYSIRLSGLTRKAVAQARARGKNVYVWTVNTKHEMNIALDLGVDGLVTDDPGLAIRLISEKKARR